MTFLVPPLVAGPVIGGLAVRYGVSARLRALIGVAVRNRIAAGVARLGVRFLSRSWYKSTFPNATKSLLYHWAKHGEGRPLYRYTRDARKFFRQKKHLGKDVTLSDGAPGVLIRPGKGQPGGYFKPDGKIVTFWYK